MIECVTHNLSRGRKKQKGVYNPTKVFDRLPNLAAHQIINYTTDSAQKWLLLVGIAQKEGRVVGSMQLHSVDRNQSQFVEGHAGAFTSYTPKGASSAITLLAFVNRSASASKVSCLRVYTYPKSHGF